MNIFLKLDFMLCFYYPPTEPHMRQKRTETITPSNSQYKFTGTQGRSKSISVPPACICYVLASPRNSGATIPEHFNAWNHKEDGWSFLVLFVYVLLGLFLETSWKDELLFRAGLVPGCNFRTPHSLEVKLGREWILCFHSRWTWVLLLGSLASKKKIKE